MKNFPTPAEMAKETVKEWGREAAERDAQEVQHLGEHARWELVKAASLLLAGDVSPLTTEERATLRLLLKVFDRQPQIAAAVKF